MTDIEDRAAESVWSGEDRIVSLEAEIHAETITREHNETAVEAVERVREAVKREVQAIQDELDVEARDE